MPYTSVQICNMALSRAGATQFITDINENSANGRMCLQWYDTCRKSLMEELPWPFALRSDTLALVEENPNDEWAYAYRYPSDAVRLNRIIGSLNEPIPYAIAGDSTGRLVYTNWPDPDMWYNIDVTTPGHFSSFFAEALAWSMCKELAILSRSTAGTFERASREYMAALNRAAGHAQNEQNPVRRQARAISVREY